MSNHTKPEATKDHLINKFECDLKVFNQLDPKPCITN